MTDMNTITTITTDDGQTVIEKRAVEVVQIATQGAQGAKGEKGDNFEFTGGEAGQAWAVLPSGEYGFDDVRRPDRVKVPFINEESIEAAYTEEFAARVYILDTKDITGHTLTVVIGGENYNYVSVGMVKINSSNQWDTQSKRMAFLHGASYIVFDETVDSWVHGELGDHSTGHRSTNNKDVLSSDGIMPNSYGNIGIDINYDSIESKHFSLCDPKVEHFTDENVIQVSFSGVPQVGFIIL